ncbi:MAG TPA: hypothetical protein VG870_09305 [Chitinophagaceae bacterium]|nr:hypothetical protein [Chitinophagaceae bacterium]
MSKPESFWWKYPFWLLLGWTVLVYAPVWLPFFHLKNDLITQNLPTRYVIGESLYSGYFPWWNPYIHYGIPQYGDMNNGFWNPVMWLIARVCGYNLLTITLEELFYILLGGWGLYLLVREYAGKQAAVLTAMAYLCCGYTVGHLQHFIWITATACFPYVLLFLVRTFRRPVLKNLVGLAGCTFLFLASTHPGLIIGAIYFLLLALGTVLRLRRSTLAALWPKRAWLLMAWLLAAAGLFSLVVICSNLDVLPHLTRGARVTPEELLLHPTNPSSYLSLLVPLPVFRASFLHTDLSMRDVYMGLPALLGLILFYRQPGLRRLRLPVTASLLFFFLLSAGGLFKQLAASLLPGIGYVRLNGEFTYFTLLILLLAAGAGLDSLLTGKSLLEEVRWWRPTLVVLFAAGALLALVMIVSRHEPAWPSFRGHGTLDKSYLKSLLDSLRFGDLLLVNCLVQLATLWLLRRNTGSWLAASAFNLTVLTWLTLPFTGLGMNSRAHMQALIRSPARGIRIPPLTPGVAGEPADSLLRQSFHLVSSYRQRLTSPVEEGYPILLRTTRDFYRDSLAKSFIQKQAWLFLASDTTLSAATRSDSSVLQVRAMGPGYLQANLVNPDRKTWYVVWLQNDYPYWSARLDGRIVPHGTAFHTFLAAELPPGNHRLEFYFNPRPIRRALWISAAVALLGLILLTRRNWRELRLPGT